MLSGKQRVNQGNVRHYQEAFRQGQLKNTVLFTVDVGILNGELNSNEKDPAIENIILTTLLLQMLCLVRNHQSLFLHFK